MTLAKKARPLSALWFLPFAFLFALQVIPRFSVDAPGGDELVDLSNGFYYWKGDVISQPHHPPLFKALAALPLRFTCAPASPQRPLVSETYDQRAHYFFFERNRDRFQGLVVQGRALALLLGLGIGGLLFLLARRRSILFLWTAMTLWTFEPDLLAYSGLTLADTPLTFFILLTVFLGDRYLDRPSFRRALVLGGSGAAAILVKFSAVILGPILLAQWFLRGKPRMAWAHLAWASGVAVLLVGVVYLPGTLVLPGHRLPWVYFLEGFRSMASYSGHPVYFLGELSEKSHWAYYPLAFLLKTPLPLIVLAGLAAFWGARGVLRFPFSWWMPGLVFFLCLSPFHNLGIREILPCYPFLILSAAAAAERLGALGGKRAPKAGLWALLGLLAFQVVSVGLSFPRHLSYFNELVPSERKIFWLGDSNLDLGQDAKRLALYARDKGWTKVKLAYFGGTDPALYGMAWEPWDELDLKGPRPGHIYAVNAAYLQMAPAFRPEDRAIVQSWISKVPPSGRLGDTWYFFEGPSPK